MLEHNEGVCTERSGPIKRLVSLASFLLVFALNPQQDSCINLLAIVVVTVILQMWAWVSGGVYKNWCLDALEGLFALNLTILGVAQLVYLCLHSTCNIHWDLCLSVGKCDWHYSIPEEKIAKRNIRQAEAEVEPPCIGSLPDRLINPGEYISTTILHSTCHC